MEYLRNVQTGEIKEVERDTDEFRELIKEVYDHNGSSRPRWEQQGDHYVRRVESGDVDVNADLGYEDTPTGVLTADVEGLVADPHPERELTAAEREAGITSYEEKLEDLGIGRSEDDSEKIARGLSRVGRDGAASQRQDGSDGEDTGPTVKELKEQARERGIPGYSSMKKAELERVLADADDEDEDDDDGSEG
jgi:hypothetical protein